MAGLAVSMALLWSASSCGNAPDTAANHALSFLMNVQQSRLGDAYDQLCSDIKARVSLEEFESTRGVAASVALRSDSWIATDVADVPDVNTLDESVTSTWREYAAHPPGGPGGDLASQIYTDNWRIRSVREYGDWKVCAFEDL